MFLRGTNLRSCSGKNFCLRSLYEPYSSDPPDLALEGQLRRRILAHLFPVLIFREVKGNIRMDNSHVISVDLLRILFFQISYSHLNCFYSQFVLIVQRRSGCHLPFRVAHNCSGIQNLSCDGVQCHSGIRSKQIKRLNHVVVNRRKQQHIRQRDPVSILFYRTGHCGHV